MFYPSMKYDADPPCVPQKGNRDHASAQCRVLCDNRSGGVNSKLSRDRQGAVFAGIQKMYLRNHTPRMPANASFIRHKLSKISDADFKSLTREIHKVLFPRPLISNREAKLRFPTD
jgi:hypothetical protein